MRFNGVQVLRGVAALLVLLVHAKWIAKFPAAGAAGDFFKSGAAIGVDLFFVISGFVVAMTSERIASAGAFMANRASRVLPLYLITSIASFALVENLTTNKVINTFALIPLFDRGSYTPPVHWFGWSIGLEMWFYAMLAGVLAVTRKHALWIFCFGVAALVGAGTFYEGDIVALRFMASPLSLEFVMGVVLWLRRADIRLSGSVLMLVAGVWFMWVGVSSRPYLGPPMIPMIDSYEGLMRVITWGLPCMLVVGGVVGLDQAGARWPALLVRFGDISYSFYLMQPFSIALLRRIYFEQWWLGWAALIALNCVVASLSFRYFERPVTAWLRRTRPALARVPSSSARPARP